MEVLKGPKFTGDRTTLLIMFRRRATRGHSISEEGLDLLASLLFPVFYGDTQADVQKLESFQARSSTPVLHQERTPASGETAAERRSNSALLSCTTTIAFGPLVEVPGGSGVSLVLSPGSVGRSDDFAHLQRNEPGWRSTWNVGQVHGRPERKVVVHTLFNSKPHWPLPALPPLASARRACKIWMAEPRPPATFPAFSFIFPLASGGAAVEGEGDVRAQ